MEKKTDRRIIRTKKAIRNAFVQLLAEKDMEAITVKEIAARADVDRKTIYNYYTGVNDILVEMENELASGFERAMSASKFDTEEDSREAFKAFTEYLKENEEVLSLIMKIDGRSRLMEKLILYFGTKVRKVFDEIEVNDSKVNLAVEFITAGLFTAYRYWFNSDKKQSLEAFTEDVISLITGGMTAYFF